MRVSASFLCDKFRNNDRMVYDLRGDVGCGFLLPRLGGLVAGAPCHLIDKALLRLLLLVLNITYPEGC